MEDSTPVSTREKRKKPGTPPGVIVIDVDDSPKKQPSSQPSQSQPSRPLPPLPPPQEQAPPPAATGGNNNNEPPPREENEGGAERDLAVRTVRQAVNQMRLRLERVFGVSFQNYDSEAEMENAQFSVEWAQGYAPARSIVDTKFEMPETGEKKYGGMDVHQETRDDIDTAKTVKFVFKTPTGVQKVMCVPYYMLAEQVRENTLYLRHLNSTVLPGLNRILYAVSAVCGAFTSDPIPASLQEAANEIEERNQRVPAFPYPSVLMGVVPESGERKRTSVWKPGHNQEARRQAQLLQEEKRLDEYVAEESDAKAKRRVEDARKIREYYTSLFGGGGGRRGNASTGSSGSPEQRRQQQQQQPLLTTPSLPEGFEDMGIDEKMDALMSAYYVTSSQSMVANKRFAEMQESMAAMKQKVAKLDEMQESMAAMTQKVAKLEETVSVLRDDVASLKDEVAGNFLLGGGGGGGGSGGILGFDLDVGFGNRGGKDDSLFG